MDTPLIMRLTGGSAFSHVPRILLSHAQKASKNQLGIVGTFMSIGNPIQSKPFWLTCFMGFVEACLY